MDDVRVALRLTGYGLRGLRRNPRVLIFTIAFPVVFLVIFAGIFGGSDKTTTLHGDEIGIDSYFTAGIIAYAIMMSAFSTLAISLTTQRESGQLKRLRGTPLPPWAFMTAQILRSLVLVILMVVALLVIGSVAFDVDVPGTSMVGFVIYCALGTATMASLGIALTSIAPTAEAASTIAPFSSVILSFISGVFIPVEQLPGWLEQIGRVFPLYHLADGLQTTLGLNPSGAGLDAGDCGVLLLWLAVGLWISIRRFQWEPQAVRG
jgi:ABC-2 type transport system permease protein